MAPFAAIALGARAIVPRVGDLMAHRIAEVGRMLRGPPTVVEERGVDDWPGAAPPDAQVAGPPPLPRIMGAPRRRVSGTTPLIFVPAERLAHLTAAQLGHVRGVDAVDVNGQAIGVRLYGVQALGLGLREGDVVTSLDGRPTRTLDDGTAAATSAFDSGRAEAQATIVREGRTIGVTVQIPRAR